jgi:hypothetical protein
LTALVVGGASALEISNPPQAIPNHSWRHRKKLLRNALVIPDAATPRSDGNRVDSEESTQLGKTMESFSGQCMAICNAVPKIHATGNFFVPKGDKLPGRATKTQSIEQKLFECMHTLKQLFPMSPKGAFPRFGVLFAVLFLAWNS